MPNVNGTTYHEGTPPEVIRILEAYRGDRKRLRVSYGDPMTGRDWDYLNIESDKEGYVSRSGGTVKIPLLIHNRRSLGAPGMLEHCIVRIQLAQGKHVLWQHPRYHVVSNDQTEGEAD